MRDHTAPTAVLLGVLATALLVSTAYASPLIPLSAQPYSTVEFTYESNDPGGREFDLLTVERFSGGANGTFGSRFGAGEASGSVSVSRFMDSHSIRVLGSWQAQGLMASGESGQPGEPGYTWFEESIRTRAGSTGEYFFDVLERVPFEITLTAATLAASSGGFGSLTLYNDINGLSLWSGSWSGTTSTPRTGLGFLEPGRHRLVVEGSSQSIDSMPRGHSVEFLMTVPEPGTAALLTIGLAGMAVVRRGRAA